MNNYEKQIESSQPDIDLDFWRTPEGVEIPDDDLRFLLIPDAVESAAIFELAKQVHEYQKARTSNTEQITSALMVTMGGLLPSVLLFDHLVEGRYANVPKIEFGTIGVSLYKGPGERYDNPLVQHGISIPVSGRTILIIDDLADYGGTMNFLKKYVVENGARKVLTLAMYIKPAAQKVNAIDFCFGETPQDTWIITPRERVETLVKRVPHWKKLGASEPECYRRLVELIGYPPEIVNYYLSLIYKHAN
jgi:hypoxanthine phosphoribosyltransferase